MQHLSKDTRHAEEIARTGNVNNKAILQRALNPVNVETFMEVYKTHTKGKVKDAICQEDAMDEECNNFDDLEDCTAPDWLVDSSEVIIHQPNQRVPPPVKKQVNTYTPSPKLVPKKIETSPMITTPGRGVSAPVFTQGESCVSTTPSKMNAVPLEFLETQNAVEAIEIDEDPILIGEHRTRTVSTQTHADSPLFISQVTKQFTQEITSIIFKQQEQVTSAISEQTTQLQSLHNAFQILLQETETNRRLLEAMRNEKHS